MNLPIARWIVVAIFFMATLNGIVTSASAQESALDSAQAEEPRFTIFPVGNFEHQWFEVTIGAGDAVELTVGLRNAGNVPVALQTYTANAFNPPNGGFDAAPGEDAPTGATRWLDYPIETFDLQPGEQRETPFIVAVPPGTPPGEYVAGLVVQTVDSWEIAGTETFRQIIRNVVSVEITVPGEMTAGYKLGTPKIFAVGAHWVLEIPIANTGTARVRPFGELVVSNLYGDTIVTSPVRMGSVYGGNTSAIRVSLPEQLAPGKYVVSIDLEDVFTGITGTIERAPVTVDAPAADEEPAAFVVDHVSIVANADPIQFATLTATITNNGEPLTTATVTLVVLLNGDEVERYPLAQNQALPQGINDFSQRYIPVNAWQTGIYTFRLVLTSVDAENGTETMLATIGVPGKIAVP